MKSLSKLLIVGVLAVSAFSAWAWWEVPRYQPACAISRVSTSETRFFDFHNENAWDLGDTTNTINEVYGGEPFIGGGPVQIEVWVALQEGSAWDTITLQYISGTDSGARAWTTIGTITEGFDSITSVKGCHFGMGWAPPATGDYLVRIHGLTTDGAENALLTGQGTICDGGPGGWDDHEVVGFTVTANTRPGAL
jgi:hypothetical protein